MAGPAAGETRRPSPPRLPKGVLPSAPPEPLESESTVRRWHYQKRDFSSSAVQSIHFETVLFEDLNLSESDWRWVRLQDARITGCNLAGARWQDGGWQRLELLTSRLLGFQTQGLLAQHLLMRGCDARLSGWSGAQFQTVRFESCDLTDASFVGADLRQATFRDCQLRGATFDGAQLEVTDLRGSNLHGIRMGLRELRGVMVEEAQLPAFASLLGLQVQELPAGEPDERP